MKTNVLLVRHGETKWNRLGKFQGCMDIELSHEGIVQAKFLAEKLNNSFDFIYTSPLKRAVETAKILCGDHKEPKIVDDLREINFGKWEGLNVKEISSMYPKEYERWRNDKVEAPLCGGDLSIKLASERARNAIIKIAEEHMGEKIVIVAHGGIIKAGLIGIFNWDMSMYHKIVLGNTSICHVILDEKLNPILNTLNDIHHLPKECKVHSYI